MCCVRCVCVLCRFASACHRSGGGIVVKFVARQGILQLQRRAQILWQQSGQLCDRYRDSKRDTNAFDRERIASDVDGDREPTADEEQLDRLCS